MKNKIIKTEQEYNEACAKVYQIINSSELSIEPDSELGEEIELLSLLIEKYEQEQYRMEAPDPIEAIKFRMDQMNLRKIDISPIFGGKTRVSEVLNRKRPLTLKMITLLNRYLGIPLESLIGGNKQIVLDPENIDKLLENTSIKNYLSNNQIATV